MSGIQNDFILQNCQLDFVMDILGECTENYVFVFDLDKDYYSISENALKMFSMPSNKFYNATEVISRMVYPDDLKLLVNDIEKLKNGESTEHNLQYRWLDKNGNFIWINCAGRVINNLENNVGGHVMIGRIARIGNRNIADNITGFYARSKLKDDLLCIKAENSVKRSAILRIGVDDFDTVNEKCGRNKGDDVLKGIADCIRNVCGGYRCYKMQGDEFLVFFDNMDAIYARECYKAIRHCVDKCIENDGYRVFYTISGGILEFDYSEIDYESILNLSAFALNQAKIGGKNRTYRLKKEDYEKHLNLLYIQEIMRKSVNNNFDGFILHYQPLIDAKTQRVVGAEALLRYESEETGFLSPAIIIPILEESGLMIPVGKWIFITAMKQAARWQKVIPDFKISINLSYVQIRNSDVAMDIMEAIKEIGIKPETVQFEFTESGLINIDASMSRLMRILGEAGVKMALDDFGTGYSSLSYLQDVNVDIIKLDRSFVANSTTNSNNFKLIKHICEMSRDMGMDICLEGVETNEELMKLEVLEPDYLQGYLYGKPAETVVFSDKYIINTSKTT